MYKIRDCYQEKKCRQKLMRSRNLTACLPCKCSKTNEKPPCRSKVTRGFWLRRREIFDPSRGAHNYAYPHATQELEEITTLQFRPQTGCCCHPLWGNRVDCRGLFSTLPSGSEHAPVGKSSVDDTLPEPEP
jgi:hypothetical protein